MGIHYHSLFNLQFRLLIINLHHLQFLCIAKNVECKSAATLHVNDHFSVLSFKDLRVHNLATHKVEIQPEKVDKCGVARFASAVRSMLTVVHNQEVLGVNGEQVKRLFDLQTVAVEFKLPGIWGFYVEFFG